MADKANDTMATSQLIGDIMKRVGTTGWTAEARADAARILKTVTGSDATAKAFTGIDPTNADLLQKQFLAQTAQAVRVMGAREPGSVISMFSKAYPSFETQPNAIKLMENVLYMQGQRAHDEFALAQQNHAQAVAATKGGGDYRPLTQFTASFNEGVHNSGNYLKAAEVMSAPRGDTSYWKGISPEQVDQIISLIPKGKTFVAPDGRMLVKP
jgi:hypothetical protein